MAAPLHMRECTDILGAVLHDPRTPPKVLVAISWNLACALKITPPFTDGFDDAAHSTTAYAKVTRNTPSKKEGTARRGDVPRCQLGGA